MVTSTAASGAPTILESNGFAEAASRAEGAHIPPGAGPGDAAGTCVQCPAAVKQLSCFSPTVSSQSTSSHRCSRGFSNISVLDPCIGALGTYQNHPPSHLQARTTGQYKATLRLEPAGRSVLVKLTISKD